MAVRKNREKCKSATISLHRGDSLSASAPPPEFLVGGAVPPPALHYHHSIPHPMEKITLPSLKSIPLTPLSGRGSLHPTFIQNYQIT